MEAYRHGCVILLFIQPIFATITFIDAISNNVRVCSDTGTKVCLQEVLIFTCSVAGPLLRWDGLNDSVIITDINEEFSSVSDAINTNSTIRYYTFILTNITGSGGVISDAEIITQNSTIVEANGLRCQDTFNGDTKNCQFTIVGDSSCRITKFEELSRSVDSITVEWTWAGSQCATSYRVNISGTESMSDTTKYMLTVPANVNTSASIIITPFNLLKNSGTSCSDNRLILGNPTEEPPEYSNVPVIAVSVSLGGVIIVILVAVLIVGICFYHKYQKLKDQLAQGVIKMQDINTKETRA